MVYFFNITLLKLLIVFCVYPPVLEVKSCVLFFYDALYTLILQVIQRS
jgi:hypothetical protein